MPRRGGSPHSTAGHTGGWRGTGLRGITIFLWYGQAKEGEKASTQLAGEGHTPTTEQHEQEEGREDTEVKTITLKSLTSNSQNYFKLARSKREHLSVLYFTIN